MAIGENQVVFIMIEGSESGATILDGNHHTSQTFQLPLDEPAICHLILGHQDARPIERAVAAKCVPRAGIHRTLRRNQRNAEA